jgi:type IV secretory pathway protease TraF
VPIGLYAIHTVGALRVGDLVAIKPPEPLASFLADRRYLPRSVPLMKHVAALAGQSVCRNWLRVSVDGVTVGEARERDSRSAAALLAGLPRHRCGRSLPHERAVGRLA